MDYNYLAKIKAQVNLYTRRKSSNILEGDFRSVFRGRSLEFDDLKEYDFGDNVHDIDWKSSSRTGKTLIRRYVAEKKHNILFVGDCGSKMEGDTPSGEQKSEVALMIFGTLAYLGDRQGADYSLAYAGDHGYRINYFRSGTDHLEKQLYSWRKEMAGNGTGVFEVLSRSVDTQRKKMMIFLITDLPGLAGLNENLVRRVTMNNDLLVIVIEDVSMFAPGALRDPLPEPFRQAEGNGGPPPERDHGPDRPDLPEIPCKYDNHQQRRPYYGRDRRAA